MLFIKKVRIHSYEAGLRFQRGEFMGVLPTGDHWFIDPLRRKRVDVVSRRQPWLAHPQLDLIARSGALDGQAVVINLRDHERALVWVDGRFQTILGPGQHAWWTTHREVRHEIVDAHTVRLMHPELALIAASGSAGSYLDRPNVAPGWEAVVFVGGEFAEVLGPGQYAFWRDARPVLVVPVDLRETTADVAGQEIMTADKVTLRLNAVAVFKVVDARRAVSVAEDVRQALYREVQLALRAVVGGRELDALLADKDAVARELVDAVRPRAEALGIELRAIGIRDIILPGEMRELLNRVTEAKKAAEANLIARREETAAIRSQANSAKMLQENPTLMRLRELETLEKIAATSKLRILVSDQGLTDRLVKMV
ncbi:MAG TPA: slipin family protein [Gemmatales bacterium]|nr:slipin family protein [Gemmatales bacterium]HMP60333.1 slipin family protein [Gemmatales bacterium]